MTALGEGRLARIALGAALALGAIALALLGAARGDSGDAGAAAPSATTTTFIECLREADREAEADDVTLLAAVGASSPFGKRWIG